MSESLGRFVWYELMTTDPQAAQAFYNAVIGWTARDAGSPGGDYTLLSMGEHTAAGLMKIPQEACDMGAPPCWTGYIAVDGVDEYVQRVQQAGGFVFRPAQDIPNVGRFAVVTDPNHAPFIIFQSLPGMTEPSAPPAGSPGLMGWNELLVDDLESTFAFYAQLFGWGKAEAVDMGPMGTYQIFTIHGQGAGGMMKKPPEAPAYFWQYYINVAEIHDTLARVKAHGGQVLHDPEQVPGGSWIAHCLDPQGVFFAVVAPK